MEAILDTYIVRILLCLHGALLSNVISWFNVIDLEVGAILL